MRVRKRLRLIADRKEFGNLQIYFYTNFRFEFKAVVIIKKLNFSIIQYFDTLDSSNSFLLVEYL